MAETNRLPLWRVMEVAYYEGRDSWHNERHGYAAEIRAMRDWLVPEEEPNFQDWLCYRQRQHLRAQLTAEAERAERGDENQPQRTP